IGQRNASLILGGIYEGNWNLISTGISNTQNNRSQYTLLGIDAENRPEVVTLTDATAQPRWDEYWFAVQAGPRLVRDGQATVTESSARAEGHANLDVTTPTRRAAIGFSRDGNQLIYVMTERGSSVSIRRLAEIMASDEVGAWQAMNLDGGDGPAISTAEEIFARPGAGRDQSHFMVVYEAAQAPEMTRAAWDRFSQANGASIFEE
ncbi:MAG: phosphodiester glycosidase family protein, partial [Cyanobacteria bacterium P01_A01_bin.17]